MWLGKKHGYFIDWFSQFYVKIFGKRVHPENFDWLLGPIGDTDIINDQYIQKIAKEENLEVRVNEPGAGLLEYMNILEFEESDLQKLNPAIRDFYEHTTNYKLELWTSWNGLFKLLGWALAKIFAHRLQQLNLPLNPMDTAKGLDSRIIKLYEKDSKLPKYVIWHRELKHKNQVVYSGIYGHTQLPDVEKGKVLRIIFPLPNGTATVVMQQKIQEDGSYFIHSKGHKSGEVGFYFTLKKGEKYWVKFVKPMNEKIHVYEDDEGTLRVNHQLNFYKINFLSLHYKIVRKG